MPSDGLPHDGTYMPEPVKVVRPSEPGSPEYGAATTVFNLAAPAEPALALTATSVDEVRSTLAWARSSGLPVRIHSTGHAAASARTMHNSLLIRTQLHGGVRIDPERRVARVPAGTTWGEVIDAAAPFGLAAPHGSSPLVGTVGYLLRGGISFYGRATGVAANSVLAIELVTADGEHRRVDAQSERELFWALRGGGGGFGVVTAVDLELFPLRQVITGAAYWSSARAEDLLSTWLDWSKTAPRACTSTLRIMNLPDHPSVPPTLRDGPVVCIDGAVMGADTDIADDLLRPLRGLAPPLLDTWRSAAPAAVAQTHMDPTEPFPVYGDHLLLNDLPDQAATALLEAAQPNVPSPLTNIELRQLGGAFAERSPSGGVFDHLAARFACLAGGVPFGDFTADDITARCRFLRGALGPWTSHLTAPSFVEHISQPQGHLSPDQVEAVDRVRADYDPSGLFTRDVSPQATARHEMER